MSDEIIDEMGGQVEPHKARMPYAVRYGVIAGLLACIYGLVLYFAGQQYNQGLGWVAYLFPIILVVVAMKAYRKDNLRRMSGNQAFGLGMLFFLIYAIVTTIYTLFYMSVINPDFITGMLDITEGKLEDRGLSDEMIEQQLKYTKMFMKPGLMAAMGIVSNLVMGAIISAIAGAILKTPKK